ncbi:MAG: type IX secretion system membrane protein PorP/SprF [Saprospiraceae bacterium]
MRRICTLTTLLLLLLSTAAFAQQDAMFTKYMFNQLTYNPAYAGESDFLNVGVIHRSQWVSVEGAPITQSFSAHTPLKNERVGVGLSVINDVIGPSRTTNANLSYAYKIPIGNMNLSIGVQGGLYNYWSDFSQLVLQDPTADEAFSMNVNLTQPNFGGGIYLSGKHFYVGASVPHLVEYDLREDVTTPIYARIYRHYYGMAGLVLPLNGDNLMFRPSVLVKTVSIGSGLRKDSAFQSVGAPTEVDIDLSLLFYQKFWLGASFRTAIEAFDNERSSYDSADLWVSYFMENGLRIGAAYDYPLTELAQVTAGSFEVMIGYEFNFDTKKTVTPRYF